MGEDNSLGRVVSESEKVRRGGLGSVIVALTRTDSIGNFSTIVMESRNDFANIQHAPFLSRS